MTGGGGEGDTIIARWQFHTTFPYYPPHAAEAAVNSAISRYGGAPPPVWEPAAAFLRSYQLDRGYTPGPLLALCTLARLPALLPPRPHPPAPPPRLPPPLCPA